jgi:biotin carboxyl carrier protein
MLQVGVNGKTTVEVSNDDTGYLLNGNAVDFDLQQQPNGLISVIKDGKSYTAILENIDRKAKEITVSVDGQSYKMTLREPIDQLLSNMGMDLKAKSKAESVKAPMPGMVLKVLVTPGQEVKKGDGLVILEAMKMENILKAGEDGTVKAIKVGERTAVEKGAILIEMGR